MERPDTRRNLVPTISIEAYEPEGLDKFFEQLFKPDSKQNTQRDCTVQGERESDG